MKKQGKLRVKKSSLAIMPRVGAAVLNSGIDSAVAP